MEEEGRTRTLVKRYRQILEFYEKVREDYGKNTPKFPSKKLVGNTNSQFVEKRRQKLEAFLNDSTSLPGIHKKIAKIANNAIYRNI